MRSIFDFIVKYYYWFLFFGLETFSIILLFQFNNYQGSVWFSTANTVVGRVKECESQAFAYFNLRQENDVLAQRNIVLEQRVARLSKKLEEVTEQPSQQELNMLDSLADYQLLPAEVVSNSISQPNNLITINKGREDGVKEEMGVVCGTGVVGVVYQAASHYSLVIPVLNAKSSISCRIRSSKYFGYLKWKGGDPLMAQVVDIPRHAKVREGDVIETSGYSSIFPAGIFVGKVKKIGNSPDGMSFMLTVHLGTDFGRLKKVYVFRCPHKTEFMQLKQKSEEEDDIIDF